MKSIHWCALLVTCALALPSLGQQKTFNWIAGSDETVSLDPGYYHAGPALQPSARAKDIRVDIEAQQPITIALLSAQAWNDATQHPEGLKDLTYLCVQEHVVKVTYTCTPPPGLPVVIVVRDERLLQSGTLFEIGEVIARHQRGQDADSTVSAGLGAALTGRPVREFFSPNNVYFHYYAWTCIDNCNLPDPPQPKLFNWVAADSESVRLDPANYFTSRTYNPGPQGSNMQVDIEAHYPVTIAMVDPPAWTDATERPTTARNLNNINYLCLQQHTVRITYTCHLPGFWPQVLVIRDEREAHRDERDSERDPSGSQGKGAAGTSAPRVIPVSVAGASLSDRSMARQFTSPNDIRIQYYSWRCVENCDQPDFGWVRQIREKFELTRILKVYGGLAPDHDGMQMSIKVKSPVPMAVAVLPSPVAGQLYGKPEMFESAVANSPCQQRGVQSSTFQCNFNVGDGPQSLVLLPETGTDIPNHKKAEVEVQAVKCIDNCTALPAH